MLLVDTLGELVYSPDSLAAMGAYFYGEGEKRATVGDRGRKGTGREFPLKVRVSKINIITIICQRVCLVVLGMR